MKAYIRAETKLGPGAGELLATFDMPKLPLFLAADRESVRRDMRQAFFGLFKKRVEIRFEDECPGCGKPLTDGGYGNRISPACYDPACVESDMPPKAELKALMARFPSGPHDGCADYLDRIKAEWLKAAKTKTAASPQGS